MKENVKLGLIAASAVLFVFIVWVTVEQTKMIPLKDTIDLQLAQLNKDLDFQNRVLDANPNTLKKCFKEKHDEACAKNWQPIKVPYFGEKSDSPLELAGFYRSNNRRCNEISFSGAVNYKEWQQILKEKGETCPGVVMTYWKINETVNCEGASENELCMPIMLTYALQWFKPCRGEDCAVNTEQAKNNADQDSTAEKTANQPDNQSETQEKQEKNEGAGEISE